MRIKEGVYNSFFHPFEITFSGYSNSGKTTLITKLVTELSSFFDIGYFKHDAHGFQVDKEGKDTYKIRDAGANNILINDPGQYAKICNSELDQIKVRNSFLDSDLLFIEGHKRSKLPKILITNDENLQQTTEDIDQEKITNILAMVGESPEPPTGFNGIYFQRDDIQNLKEFVLNHLTNKIPIKVNGLILTGGKSSRMGENKGALVYHQEDQVSHLSKLISPFCEEVFVSCKEEHKDLPHLRGHNLLFDSFPGGGPSTGILSAMNTQRDIAWLIVGCDLPYLDKKTLSDLFSNRNPFKLATCFLNPTRNWPEPICTIYEPKAYNRLMDYYAYNRPCPRKVLFNSNIQKLKLENKTALDNVNTPEEKQKAINYFNKKGDFHAN